MARREFSVAVRKAAWERCGGFCECGCGVKILPGDGPEFDHRIEAALGGEPTVENCIVTRKTCHKAKTRARASAVAKALRLERHAANIRPRKAVIAGSRASRWKKPINGPAIRRTD